MEENYVEYQLGDGSTILIEETVPRLGGQRAVASDGGVSKAASKLEETISPLSKLAQEMKDVLKSNINSPDEITIEFGAKLSADFGLIVAKSQVEANFKVSLTWNKATPKPS